MYIPDTDRATRLVKTVAGYLPGVVEIEPIDYDFLVLYDCKAEEDLSGLLRRQHPDLGYLPPRQALGKLLYAEIAEGTSLTDPERQEYKGLVQQIIDYNKQDIQICIELLATVRETTIGGKAENMVAMTQQIAKRQAILNGADGKAGYVQLLELL
jgi:hypothetical protein